MSLKPRFEKNVYQPGQLLVTASSNGWRLLQNTRILKCEMHIAEPTTGEDSTIVTVIKNGTTVLYSGEFAPGGSLSVTLNVEKDLVPGDVLTVSIPQIASEDPGADLLVQFLCVNP